MSALTAQLFHTLIWLVPLAILVAVIKSPGFKGWFGEWQVKTATRKSLDPAIYRALHNITIPSLDGTTQIDHIFVSRFGIFVVETKNYSGWIFGDEKQAQWTQQIYKKRSKFQNPLRQNYKHHVALATMLGIAQESIHPVIVFLGGCEFKTQMPENVTQTGGLIRYIKSKTAEILTAEEVERIYQQISTGRLAPNRATHRAHVEQLQKRSDPNAARLCPKCGQALVLRTTKTGGNAGKQFWGCSQYPKCRFNQTIG